MADPASREKLPVSWPAMPALRLKTKLVVAITAMVVVIVLTLAAVHISDMVH